MLYQGSLLHPGINIVMTTHFIETNGLHGINGKPESTIHFPLTTPIRKDSIQLQNFKIKYKRISSKIEKMHWIERNKYAPHEFMSIFLTPRPHVASNVLYSCNYTFGLKWGPTFLYCVNVILELTHEAPNTSLTWV